jgi:hypothetical protein
MFSQLAECWGAGSLNGRLQTDPRKNYSLLVFKYVWDNREV